MKTEVPEAKVVCSHIPVTVESVAADRVETPGFLTRLLKTIGMV